MYERQQETGKALCAEVNQASAVRSCPGLGKGYHIHLMKRTFDVSLDRAFADEKFDADFFVALSSGDPL